MVDRKFFKTSIVKYVNSITLFKTFILELAFNLCVQKENSKRDQSAKKFKGYASRLLRFIIMFVTMKIQDSVVRLKTKLF